MESSEQLISELEDLYCHIVKVQENFKKCPKSRLTKGYLEARIQCLDEYWISYRNAHRNLLKIVPRDKRKQFDYFNSDNYGACEDVFMQVKADIKDALSQVLSPTSPVRSSRKDESNIISQSTQVKLPRIQLPAFSGNYEEWPNFQDLFTSLVHHDKSLSKVQKLHYLKTSVNGEAETLLKHVQITEDNYEQAWDILKSRYSNKRVIVNSLLKRLCSQKKIMSQTANQIKSLHDTTMECLNSLKNLDIQTDTWDPLVVFLVVQKLDNETHKEWEDRVSKEDSETLPTLNMQMKFLESRFRMLELLTPASSKDKFVRERSLHVSTAERICIMCQGNHALCHCKDFGKMEPTQRGEFVKNKHACFNCLVPGHSVKSCRLSISCRICRKRHHTLLHQTRSTTNTQGSTSTDNQPKVSAHVTVEEKEIETRVNTVLTPHSQQHTGNKNNIALLATAVVTVRSEEGSTTVLRALIDPGSESCFITERAAQSLKVRRQPVKGSILGMGSMKSRITQVVQVEVLSRCSQFNLQIEAYVINKQLTTDIPKHTITKRNWPHIAGLTLADPNFYKPGSIDLLLGHNEYAQILQDGLIKGAPGSPCAQNTSLGWILFGRVNHNSQPEQSITVMHNQIEVEDMLKVLWEIDTNTRRKFTKEEEICEKIYEETHKRNEEGRYIVQLPFNIDNPKCLEGNTRSIALKRLEYLERRLNNNQELKKAYTEVMDEYIRLGHMEEVPTHEITNRAVYLPHHAVVRSDKETTQTRVVFDASCKGHNGVSLNDELLVGPVLQEDLRSIVMRWRLHKICFTSDIEKMYRMVLVTKDSSDFQRVLWRQNTSTFDEIRDYRLLTVTFGTSSAPYLAVRTLIQLAHDEGSSYPAAARIIKEDCYVDDVMSGCDNVAEAIEVSKQLQSILSKGKFTLKKWTSNSAEFLRSIEPDKRSAKASLDFKMDGTVKALGLSWNLRDDVFYYNLTLPALSNNNITKRSILADLQRLFDPLGWIAPIVVKAKLLVQKLWLLGVGWDDPIDEDLQKQWQDLRNDVSLVNDIKVTRWLNTPSTVNENVNLHGFSDASMHAISAVVYCRTINSNGVIRTNIVAARTKVAPVKPMSIPRLELCGAVLVSKLLHHAAQAMRIPSSQIYAWTDSSITLSWLFGEPNRWKPFVANRVVEILDIVGASQWHHVESEHNPADIASRGATTSELQNSKLWWYGPEFLKNKEIKFTRPNVRETDMEKRKIKVLLNIEEIENKSDYFEQFNSLTELQITISYCRRFLNFKKINNMEEYITTEELDKALKICIRKAQTESFTTEIEAIRKHKEVKKTSSLKSLNPYLDDDNILRVGGRLRHANLSLENKHPIILDHKHSLTSLIIADAHQKTLHGGIQLMLCYLRTKYWIIRAKRAVKSHFHKCFVCAKIRAKTRTQLMGDLPYERVTPARPFLHSGVDFAGPYNVLFSKGRGGKTTKAYICIFVCMCTKAVHLELVGDLTSEAFIGAFRRFIARRGRCTQMFSDQGRNFVGANRELVDAWKEAKLEFQGPILDSLAKEGTQWNFNAPYSPSQGGLWEASVKSLKYHLRRILTTNLTYEEMSTILCEIEACLNSRPLCPIDDTDVENLNPLTPGHFLLGEAPTTVPTPALKNVNISNLSRWRYTQKLLRDLWQRWQQEYLSRLQQRPKWLRQKEEFQINDIVLVKQDNLPPGKWMLGRIVAKHPGSDNITRVYSIKSGNTITRRCVSKLCFLPVTDNQLQNV